MVMIKNFRCDSGAAAAEMALVLPILITLMFGSFELGNYFLNQHIIVKAVRDGARYASRQNFTYFPCTSAGTDLSIQNDSGNAMRDQIFAVTRTGQVTSNGSPRLTSWTDASHISVTYDCITTNSNADYSGIYSTKSYVPRVKVMVSGQQYSSLFASMGWLGSSLTLNAQSQATVAGI